MSEMMDVVDSNDQVIGKGTRKEIHDSGAWHRGAHVFVFNHSGGLLLPLRSPLKDKFPDTYDCSLSEHVKAGETFEEAAVRGLREELGVIGPELKKLLKFKMNYGLNDNTVAVLYECKSDRALTIDESEVTEITFLEPTKIKEMLIQDPAKFAPWTRELLLSYFQLPSILQELPS